jgi:hypothetical protein
VARIAVPILALVLGAALAVALVSCGGRDKKGLLPGDNAQQILANLTTVEQLASSGDCADAALKVDEVQSEIDALPTTVDARLRSRLREGAQKLSDIVNSPGACETTTTESTTEPSTSSSTTTKKPKTTTTSTSTTTTSPTSTSTSTTTTTTPTTTTNTTGGTGTPGGVAPPGQRKGTGHLPPGQAKKDGG